MKTYTINKPKELNQFKDVLGCYSYYVDGNLKAYCDLKIKGYLYVSGFIEVDGFIEAGEYIKVGGYIKAGGFIEVDGFIEAGEYIKANGFIEAGGHIKAGTYIEAGQGILTGLSITCNGTLKAGGKIFAGCCTWREITDEEKTITCEKLIGGKVESRWLRVLYLVPGYMEGNFRNLIGAFTKDGILKETLKGKNLTRKELKKLYNLVEKTETKPDLIVDGKFYKEITSSKEEQ